MITPVNTVYFVVQRNGGFLRRDRQCVPKYTRLLKYADKYATLADAKKAASGVSDGKVILVKVTMEEIG